MFRTSILGTLAIAFATSSLACVATGDELPAPPEASVGSVSSAMGTVAIEPVVKLADLLLGQFSGKALADKLFPPTPIDYARLTKSFTDAMNQANVAQTVSEQGADVDGTLKTLDEVELRLANKGNPDDAYNTIAGMVPKIDGVISTLSAPNMKVAGLPTYVVAAQVKLSMLGKMMQLRPADVGNQTLLQQNGKLYLDYVVKTKREIQTATLKARLDAIGVCETQSSAFDTTVVFTDTGVQTDDGTQLGTRWWTFTAPDGPGGSLDQLINNCQSSRFAYVTRAGTQMVTLMREPSAWIDTMVEKWTNLLGTPAMIRVKGASYGANVGATSGNVTQQVAMTCDNQNACTYAVSVQTLGDPAYYRGKDFSVQYACYQNGREGETKTATVGAEANGQSASLVCP
jgi:hypothetical protein